MSKAREEFSLPHAKPSPRTGGREAILALLKRFVIWRVGFRWYLVALLLLLAIYAAAVALDAIVRQTPVDFSTVIAQQIFGPSANLPVLVLPFFLFDAPTNGEEMGANTASAGRPDIATLMILLEILAIILVVGFVAWIPHSKGPAGWGWPGLAFGPGSALDRLDG